MASSPYYGGRSPIIVQGIAVSDTPYYEAQTYNNSSSSSNNNRFGRGTFFTSKQSSLQKLSSPTNVPQQSRHQFRDVLWAVLFYAHLVAMAYATVVYGSSFSQDMLDAYASDDNNNTNRRQMSETWNQPSNQSSIVSYVPRFVSASMRFLMQSISETSIHRYLQENDAATDNTDTDIQFNSEVLMTTLLVSVMIGLVISTLALGFMMAFAATLIRMALIFNIVFFSFMGFVSLLWGVLGSAIIMLFFAAFSTYYAYMVWSRIPFAAANLRTSLAAVRANIGVAFYSYLSIGLIFGWSVWWGLTTIATVYTVSNCDVADGSACDGNAGTAIFILFLLSYYWVVQVLNNVVHVTTAGTVGTWWFTPSEANGCCSSAVCNSYFRSITYSFGSICLGSLIVAIIQTVKEIIHSARDNNDSALACCAECLIGCIESLIEVRICLSPAANVLLISNLIVSPSPLCICHCSISINGPTCM
jgi:hypothetical protein